MLQDRYGPSRLNGCLCGQIGGASSGERITYKREDSHVLQKSLLRWDACDMGGESPFTPVCPRPPAAARRRHCVRCKAHRRMPVSNRERGEERVGRRQGLRARFWGAGESAECSLNGRGAGWMMAASSCMPATAPVSNGDHGNDTDHKADQRRIR